MDHFVPSGHEPSAWSRQSSQHQHVPLDLRTRIADHLIGQGRTTDDPHLTVAVVNGHDNTGDRLLARTDIRIADCTVTHVDIAHAGPRGAEADTIGEFALGDYAAPNATP